MNLEIWSGGQSGVDRPVLDVAREFRRLAGSGACRHHGVSTSPGLVRAKPRWRKIKRASSCVMRCAS